MDEAEGLQRSIQFERDGKRGVKKMKRLIVVLACILIPGAAIAESSWTIMHSGTDNQIQAVWGAARDDVFAVGEGTILHYDGKTWTQMLSIPETVFMGVRGCIKSFTVAAFPVILFNIFPTLHTRYRL